MLLHFLEKKNYAHTQTHAHTHTKRKDRTEKRNADRQTGRQAYVKIKWRFYMHLIKIAKKLKNIFFL